MMKTNRPYISNIVFTRNRPLQLEAYLESLHRHVAEGRIQTYILYKADLFDEQYSDLFRRFSHCIIVEERHFHDDFINLVNQIDTEYIIFGTDDVIYYDSVNFNIIREAFETFPDEIFGFSLRFSPSSLAGEGDNIIEMDMCGEKVYKLNWKRGKSRNAKYPFELNSTVYRVDLVKHIVNKIRKEHPMLKKIFKPGSYPLKILGLFLSKKDFLVSINTFNNPNTLEGFCYRWCRGHKSQLPDNIYFQKLCASAIQINRVNTIVDNPVDGLGDHTVEILNEKYCQGFRFDYETIEANKPDATHVGHDYFFLVKRA